MQNRIPEKRVGIALLLIGGFALGLYIINSSVTQQADPATFLFLLFILLLGWGLRERFKAWGAPPPRPAGGGAKPAPSGGLSLPWGKKKPSSPPPAPPKPAAPPPGPKPKPKDLLGSVDNFFKPKNKK